MAINSTIFIDNGGHMNMGRPHFKKEVRHSHGVRNKQDFAPEIQPITSVFLTPEINQILDMEHAGHVIQRFAVNGHARMARLLEPLVYVRSACYARWRNDTNIHPHPHMECSPTFVHPALCPCSYSHRPRRQGGHGACSCDVQQRHCQTTAP